MEGHWLTSTYSLIFLSMDHPIPVGSNLLVEPIYDPEKIGSIYLPGQAQNSVPTSGTIVAVGPLQTEIEVGYRVLVSAMESVHRDFWYDEAGHEHLFYKDNEVVGFITDDGDVFPRQQDVLVRPSWDKSGPVKHGSLFTIDRTFEVPMSPRYGTILRTGGSVTTLKRGDVVVLPRTGGNELGVRDRVLYTIKESDIVGILTHAVEINTTKSHRRRAKAT